MIRILVALTFISLATARPGFKNIFDRVLHKKAFDHVMKKRTDEGACVATATVVGELLDDVAPVFMEGIGIPEHGHEQNEVLNRVINHLAGFDVFDQEQRERVLCRLSGLSSLSELLAAEKELGLDYQAVKDVHDYLAATIPITRYMLRHFLDESPSWFEEDFVQQQENLYELMLATETSGILALDTEGIALLSDVVSVFIPSYSDMLTPLEVSDAPTNAKCRRIANAARKVWNDHITAMSSWNPDASHETRDLIKQWTGIDLANHGTIRSMICELLESGLDGGVRGIYEWLEERRVLRNLTRTGYPILVDQLQQLKMMLEMMSNNGPPSAGGPQLNYDYPSYGPSNYPSYGPSNYPSYDPSNYPSYGPSNYQSNGSSEEYINRLERALQALEGLEGMGLLSLTDDL